MRPKISYSILNLKKFSKDDFLFEAYELRASSIRPNIKLITDLKEKFNGENLSMHSGLSRIFSCIKKGYPNFSNSEMDILKYEIMISKIIGIKKIIFHMTHDELKNEEIKKFKEMMAFAKKEGVELIYENHVCSARAILYLKEKFPELKMCLDFGHLNLAISKNIFEMDLEDFLEEIKEKIIHVHIHNNDGKKDLHQEINNGTFDWKKVLVKLPNLEKVIVEVMDEDEARESKKLLEEFYQE